jgi:hypothetical protein
VLTGYLLPMVQRGGNRHERLSVIVTTFPKTVRVIVMSSWKSCAGAKEGRG